MANAGEHVPRNRTPEQEQEESDRNLEKMLESPHEGEHSARSLEDEVDSNATLQGYYAMNNVKPTEGLEESAKEDKPESREKGHPVP